MSIDKDYRRQIAEIKRRTDISKAEAERLISQAYKEAQKALKEELRKIDENAPRATATAQANGAVKQYADDMVKALEQATSEAVKKAARQTAEAHVKAEQNLLMSAGLKPTPQVFLVGQNEVNATVARTLDKILKGTAYPDGYTLSQRIWSNSQAVHKDIHTIIMNGMQQGKSIADISDSIKGYVDPKVYKDWNKLMQDGYKVHRRNVEYNSQRLARTVAQHSYQQATEDRARSNPFIVGFRWIANGSRACPICLDRDGTVYDVGSAPLDHPNGMCVLEPVFMGEDGDPTARARSESEDPFAGMSMDDRLVAWAHGGEDPELSAWGRRLGYEV